MLFYFKMLLLAMPVFSAVAQFGNWTIIDPADTSKVVTYTNSTGYSFFLLRGNIASTNCGTIDSYSQYGCVYSAKCLEKSTGFSQCPSNYYYSRGTTAVCNEYVSMVGGDMVVQFQMDCNIDYSRELVTINSSNSTVSAAAASVSDSSATVSSTSNSSPTSSITHTGSSMSSQISSGSDSSSGSLNSSSTSSPLSVSDGVSITNSFGVLVSLSIFCLSLF
ncbi:hypothetical protein AYI68_g6347 [Smittium mucronatum]|uniref:Uncharacterized protein n=1 Tax=Smittium mucronatum TaxID=133383 RepID=A0A1R0GRS2_9FUNG|nr:hypothetical protein AYI68_g6347 [Smittium mucronatum]